MQLNFLNCANLNIGKIFNKQKIELLPNKQLSKNIEIMLDNQTKIIYKNKIEKLLEN